MPLEPIHALWPDAPTELLRERNRQEHAEMEQTMPKRMPNTTNWQSMREASVGNEDEEGVGAEKMGN